VYSWPKVIRLDYGSVHDVAAQNVLQQAFFLLELPLSLAIQSSRMGGPLKSAASLELRSMNKFAIRFATDATDAILSGSDPKRAESLAARIPTFDLVDFCGARRGTCSDHFVRNPDTDSSLGEQSSCVGDITPANRGVDGQPTLPSRVRTTVWPTFEDPEVPVSSGKLGRGGANQRRADGNP